MSLPSEDKVYTKGTQNRFIHSYFYLQRGLGLANEFHGIFNSAALLYIALRIEHIFPFAFLSIPALLILVSIGWYSVHKMGKVTDWLSVRYGSHYALNQYQLQQETRDLLKAILKELQQKHGK